MFGCVFVGGGGGGLAVDIKFGPSPVPESTLFGTLVCGLQLRGSAGGHHGFAVDRYDRDDHRVKPRVRVRVRLVAGRGRWARVFYGHAPSKETLPRRLRHRDLHRERRMMHPLKNKQEKHT